jgi:hypothetical protein
MAQTGRVRLRQLTKMDRERERALLKEARTGRLMLCPNRGFARKPAL